MTDERFSVLASMVSSAIEEMNEVPESVSTMCCIRNKETGLSTLIVEGDADDVATSIVAFMGTNQRVAQIIYDAVVRRMGESILPRFIPN